MPASIIAELILQPVLELVFYTGAYYLGRLLVPLISLGRWQCDPLLRDTPKRKQKRIWSGFWYRRGTQLYLTADGTVAVGLLLPGLALAAFLWRYLNS